MRRIATAALLGLGIVCTIAQPARAQTLLFDYVGFDYEDPIVVPGTFGAVGNGYVGVGEVPVIPAPFLVTDHVNNQYTYHLTGLVSTARAVMGNLVVIDYSAGTLKLYEDPKAGGTPFDYGINPPNATSPSTFMDGTAILEFAVTDFRYIFNTTAGSGSYDSRLQVTGGTMMGDVPPNLLTGWQFAGVTRNSVTIPQGYVDQVDGQVFLGEPTLSRASSWGQLKRVYR